MHRAYYRSLRSFTSYSVTGVSALLSLSCTSNLRTTLLLENPAFAASAGDLAVIRDHAPLRFTFRDATVGEVFTFYVSYEPTRSEGSLDERSLRMRTESPIREKIVISTDTAVELSAAFYTTARTSRFWIFAGADEIGSLVAHEPNVMVPQKMTLDATIRGQAFVLAHVGKSPCAGSSCGDYSVAMERGEELVALFELKGDGSGGCSVMRGLTDEMVQDILTLFIYADVAARRMRRLGH